jgi:hypothetical protein
MYLYKQNRLRMRGWYAKKKYFSFNMICVKQKYWALLTCIKKQSILPIGSMHRIHTVGTTSSLGERSGQVDNLHRTF